LNRVALASVIVGDAQRKSFPRILVEAFGWMLRERELPQHYFAQFLYRNGADPRRFIGRKRCWRIRRQYFYRGIEHSIPYLENKHLFWAYLRSTDLPIIEVVAHSMQNAILDAGTGTRYEFGRWEDVSAALEQISASRNQRELFAKPVFGLQGGGCIVFRDGVPIIRSPEAAFDLLRRFPYVFQPRLKQESGLEAVNPSSINTIRLNVLREGEEPGRILAPFAKFGTGDAVVDNGGSGGLILPLDPESGAAAGPAFRLLKQGGGTYEEHPDTGYPFSDFRVPDFDRACAVAIRASAQFPNRFVGWDLAITEAGPVIVEGNSGPNLDCIQMLVGGFRGHPEFSPIFSAFL